MGSPLKDYPNTHSPKEQKNAAAQVISPPAPADTLSDKIKDWSECSEDFILVEDVKEFIRQLKKVLVNKDDEITEIIHNIIDKLAGEELI